MKNIISTATIRERGQLTVPEELRRELDWLEKGSIVNIELSSSDSVTIKPYQRKLEDQQKKWKKIWDGVRLARSFKGKRGNLADFIVKDRERR